MDCVEAGAGGLADGASLLGPFVSFEVGAASGSVRGLCSGGPAMAASISATPIMPQSI